MMHIPLEAPHVIKTLTVPLINTKMLIRSRAGRIRQLPAAADGDGAATAMSDPQALRSRPL